MEKKDYLYRQNNKFSLKKRAKSFVYAFKGIGVFVITQHNVWIHLVAAILVIVFGFVFNVNFYEWCLLVFAIGFVLTAEIFNTTIEYFVDFVSPELNKKAGLIKDMAAGGVLISAITAAIIGIIIFLPKIIFVL